MVEDTITNLRRRRLPSVQVFPAEAILRVQVARAVFLITQVPVHARVNDTASRVVAIGSNWIVGVPDADTRMIRVVKVEVILSTSRGARDVTGSL